MNGAGGELWSLLEGAGNGIALTVIIALALAIAAISLLFATAAVAVLGRFARSVRRLRGVALAVLLWGLPLALVGLDWVGEAGARSAAAAPPGSFLPGALSAAIAALALWWGLPLGLLGLDQIGGWLEGAAAVPGALPIGFALGSIAATALAAAAVALVLRWLSNTALLLAALGVVVLALAVTATPAALLGIGLCLGLPVLAIAGFLHARGSAAWWIALRYLVAKRRQTFISVITAICVGGVAAGVWLIITVLSVMNGFERTWREEIIGNRAHFTVRAQTGYFRDYRRALARVLTAPGIVAASPFLDAEGIVRGGGGRVHGVQIHGVDPARIASVTDLGEDLRRGSLAALAEPAAEGDFGIVVGSQLADELGLELGSPLVLISPFGGPPTPFGSAPRLVRFRVVGVFHSDFFQYDQLFTYVSLEAAQHFLRLDDVAGGIEVRTVDYYRSVQLATAVQRALGAGFYTVDWKDLFPAFFQALKTERVMMFVLLTMIMVVAAFAVVVTLMMMIMEKTSDIAILKAMGAEDGVVERIFAIEGALIGAVGTVLGILAGIAVTARLGWIQGQVERWTGIDALPASVYQGISELPTELRFAQIGLIAAIAMALSLGGTWVPSRQAARLSPVEALRYE